MASPEMPKPAADKATGFQKADKNTPNIKPLKPSPQAKWKSRNPLALWAHSATRSAIKRGLLVPPKDCQACGKVAPLDAHHDDWTDPLSIKFWCRSCHRQHHAAMRKGPSGGKA